MPPFYRALHRLRDSVPKKGKSVDVKRPYRGPKVTTVEAMSST